MKHLFKLRWALLFVLIFSYSCSKDDDATDGGGGEEITLESDVNDFVWKSMNSWYLWQSEVGNLADSKDDNTNSYYEFLNGYDTPEGLFSNVLSSKDRFSYIESDYNNLFNSFSGVAKTNGVQFVVTRPPEGGTKVIGVVRYVVNGSDADVKGIKRGDIFYAIDGTELYAVTDSQGKITESNFSLFDSDSYTMNFANIENNQVVANNVNVELNKSELTENPIHIHKTLDVNGTKIGYLMYNQFVADFDEQLNDAFSQFKSSGATELVIDLRYNPGGSVTSSTRLASLITGQFTGSLFSKATWNSKWSDFDENNNFVDNIDGTALNSLNLSKVYIIATDDSASASELLINGLDPWIQVIHIGDTTVGKNEFSITLIDNPSGATPYAYTGENSLANANPNHKYALQPLVGTNENADGFSDFTTGLIPDIEKFEVLGDLGTLGDINEPLLATAIEQITGVSAKSLKRKFSDDLNIKTLKSSNDFLPYRKISNYDLYRLK
ncbi:S41 family peptidase [Galbibacter sp. BG1]